MSGATPSTKLNAQTAAHKTGVFMPHPKTQTTRIERRMISDYNKATRLGEARSTCSSEADISTQPPNTQHPDSVAVWPQLHTYEDVRNSAEQALPNLTPVSSPTCARGVDGLPGPGESFAELTAHTTHENSSKVNMRVSIAQSSGHNSWSDFLAAPEVGGWSIPRSRGSSHSCTSRRAVPLPPPPPTQRTQQQQDTQLQAAAGAVAPIRYPAQGSAGTGSSDGSNPAVSGMQRFIEVPNSFASRLGSSPLPAPMPAPRPRRRSKVISPASSTHLLLLNEECSLQQQQLAQGLSGSSSSAWNPSQLLSSPQRLLTGMQWTDVLAGGPAQVDRHGPRTQQEVLQSAVHRNSNSAPLPQAGDQVQTQSSAEPLMVIDEQIIDEQLVQGFRQQGIAQSLQAAKIAAGIAASAAENACIFKAPSPGGMPDNMMASVAAPVPNIPGGSNSGGRHQLLQASLAAAPDQSFSMLQQLQMLPELAQQMSGLALEQQLPAGSFDEACASLDSLQLNAVASFGGASPSMSTGVRGSITAAMRMNMLDQQQQQQQQVMMQGCNTSGSFLVGSAMLPPSSNNSEPFIGDQSHYGDQSPYGGLTGPSPTVRSAADSGPLQGLGQRQPGQQPRDWNAAATDTAARHAAVASKMRQLAMVQNMQQQLLEELLQLLQ